MKKVIAILLIAMGIVSFACSKEVDKKVKENAVGMPNPMVEVTNQKEFSNVLSIRFDTNYLPQKNFKQFIIADSIGDARFTMTNKDGTDIDCMFRCTKDKEISKKLSGIYDTNMKKVDTKTYGFTDVFVYEAPTEGYMIYSFHSDKEFYELATKGKLDDDIYEDVIKKCFKCVNIDFNK